MKNKVKLKKYVVATIIASICLFIIFIFLNVYEYNTYTSNFNNKIGSIINVVKEKYPDVNEKEIAEILNSNNTEVDFFNKYGIDIDTSILVKNDKSYNLFIIINSIFFISVFSEAS